MVVCLIALPILLVLGIFSTHYRALAREGIDCVFRKMTLRPCRSKLDDRIQAGITGRVLRFSPGAAGFLRRHFAFISFMFLLVLSWSTYSVGVGAYNFYYYGNCNGPDQTGFCLFDPLGEHTGTSETGTSCRDASLPTHYDAPNVTEDDPIRGSEGAILTVLEFGCYSCEYTKKAEPVVREILERYDGRVNVQFITVPILAHPNSYQAAMAGQCAWELGVYEPYHTALFSLESLPDRVGLIDLARKVGMDEGAFTSCYDDPDTRREVDADVALGMEAGVGGTPTFFVGDKVIVGPRPFRTFETVIDAALEVHR